MSWIPCFINMSSINAICLKTAKRQSQYPSCINLCQRRGFSLLQGSAARSLSWRCSGGIHHTSQRNSLYSREPSHATASSVTRRKHPLVGKILWLLSHGHFWEHGWDYSRSPEVLLFKRVHTQDFFMEDLNLIFELSHGPKAWDW